MTGEADGALDTKGPDHGRDSGDGVGVWDLDLLGGVVEAVEEEIMTPRMAPIGLRLHLADVWVDEVYM